MWTVSKALTKHRQGLVGLARGDQPLTLRETGLRVIGLAVPVARLDPQCLAIVRKRLLESPATVELDPQIIVRDKVILRDRGRPGEQRHTVFPHRDLPP